MLTHALEYAELGYPIFPVCSPLWGAHTHPKRDEQTGAWIAVPCPKDRIGKTPVVAWGGAAARVPSKAQIHEWWRRFPNANIGMATGVLSGVIVLDADSGDAKKLAMERGGLDRTPAVFTGKPGGIHFWLEHPGYVVRNFARRLPGTDLRADGGYVLLPPSLHASGARYRWVGETAGLRPAPVPEWLSALLNASESAADAPEGDVLRLEDIVAGIQEGARDTTLFRLAGKMRHANVPLAYAEFIVELAARQCSPPFPAADAVEKVRRAYREYAPAPDADDLIDFSDTADETPRTDEGQDSATIRYPVQTLAALTAMEQDEVAQIVAGVLWGRRTHWFFSDPNSGKTLFLLALLMHIAAGRPFLGRPVVQMPVLLIEEDSPFSVIGDYVEMLADIYDIALDGLPFYVNALQGLRVVNAEARAAVVEAVAACPKRPGVVLLDACERLVPSDRFNTKELDELTLLLQWMLSQQITPVVIDHTNRMRPEKGKEKEFKANPMERLFGARAKMAISDVMVYFDGFLKTGGVEVVFAKFRGEIPPGYRLQFDPASGFEITDKPPPPASDNERRAMRIFNGVDAGWYSPSEVLDLVNANLRANEKPMTERTLRRVLSTLAGRRWIVSEGATSDRRYRLNPDLSGLFQ